MDKAQILGPFLCHPTHHSMSFWFSFGPELVEQEIRVDVLDSTGVAIRTCIAGRVGEIYQTYIAKAEGLKTASDYTYSVKLDGDEWLPPGLGAGDLEFKTLADPASSTELSLALLSCHGLDAWNQALEKDRLRGVTRKSSHNMWDQLYRSLGSSPVDIILLGGDQVYMDEEFSEDLSRFDQASPAIDIHRRIYKVYVQYWGFEQYRRIFAQNPAFMMWDDHDIVDGWGSRLEAQREPDKWKAFGNYLYPAFDEMQAVRNSGQLKYSPARTFVQEFGPVAIVGLDLRSERRPINPTQALMLEPDHKEIIEERLTELGSRVEHLIWLTPVTVARMGGKVENLMSKFANFFWSLGARVGYTSAFKRVLLWSFIFLCVYSALHSEIRGVEGLLQSIMNAAVLMAVPRIYSKELGKYFPKTNGRIKCWLNTAAVVSSGIALVIGYLNFEALPRSFFETWFTGSQRELIAGLSLALLSITFFFAKSSIMRHSPKAKRTTSIFGYLAGAALCVFVLYSLWLGAGSNELTIITSLLFVFAYLPLLLFVIVAYVVAAGEASGVIETIAGLDDDMRDAWSSESLSGELLWWTNLVEQLHSNALTRQTILSGDIHTGGVSIVRTENVSIPQIVASPMSYVTMPVLAERLTSAGGSVSMRHEDREICQAQNVFYRSERNFALLKIEANSLNVKFVFEDLASPVSMEF